MFIYIVRHGETDWNNSLKIQGRTDNKLNNNGIIQANKLHNKISNINFTKVYSSSLQRAYQTAEISTNHKYNILIDDHFIERNFGDLEGLDSKEYYKVNDFNKIKGFENDEKILSRVDEGLKKIILNSNQNDIIGIFSHSHVLKSILILFDHEKYSFDTKIKNCGILKLEINKNKILNIEYI